MASLDFQHVEKTGIVTNEQSAWHRQPRQRLRPAFDDGARSISDALTALESFADQRMMLRGARVTIAA